METDRAGLVAEYVGQTAIKTQGVIDQALGDVLFIDEAYTLVNQSQNDYGRETIDTILKAMEDRRNNLVVIVAGYTQQMQDFLASNPDLRSRFTRSILFEDYSPQELEAIFRAMSRQVLSPEAEKELHRIILRMYENRDPHFGNGREARNFYELAVKKPALRVSLDPELPVEQWNRFQSQDLLQAETDFFREPPKPKKKNPIGFY